MKYNNYTHDPDLFIENSRGMKTTYSLVNPPATIMENANENHISVLSRNIRSATEYLESLLARFIVHNGKAFDVTGLKETRPSSDIQHLLELPCNTYFSNRSRKSSGGSLYVHKRFDSIARIDFTHSEVSSRQRLQKLKDQ